MELFHNGDLIERFTWIMLSLHAMFALSPIVIGWIIRDWKKEGTLLITQNSINSRRDNSMFVHIYEEQCSMIFVKVPSGQVFCFKWKKGERVSHLVKWLEDKEGIPSGLMYVSHGGKILGPDLSWEGTGLLNLDSVDVWLKLSGGSGKGKAGKRRRTNDRVQRKGGFELSQSSQDSSDSDPGLSQLSPLSQLFQLFLPRRRLTQSLL